MDGKVDKRSPQSHLCDPGSIPVLAVSCGLSLLLVLALLQGLFSGLSPSTKSLLALSYYVLPSV